MDGKMKILILLVLFVSLTLVIAENGDDEGKAAIEVAESNIVNIGDEEEPYYAYVLDIPIWEEEEEDDEPSGELDLDCESLENPLHRKICNQFEQHYNGISVSECREVQGKIAKLKENTGDIVSKKIDEHSTEYGYEKSLLSPNLAYAHIQVESGFLPNAVNDQPSNRASYPEPSKQKEVCENASVNDSFGIMQIAKLNITDYVVQLKSKISCSNWASEKVNIDSGIEIWYQSYRRAVKLGCDDAKLTQFDGKDGTYITAIGLYNNSKTECTEITNENAAHTESYIGKVLAWKKMLDDDCEKEATPEVEPIPYDEIRCNTILECLEQMGHRFAKDILDP